MEDLRANKPTTASQKEVDNLNVNNHNNRVVHGRSNSMPITDALNQESQSITSSIATGISVGPSNNIGTSSLQRRSNKLLNDTITRIRYSSKTSRAPVSPPKKSSVQVTAAVHNSSLGRRLANNFNIPLHTNVSTIRQDSAGDTRDRLGADANVGTANC